MKALWRPAVLAAAGAFATVPPTKLDHAPLPLHLFRCRDSIRCMGGALMPLSKFCPSGVTSPAPSVRFGGPRLPHDSMLQVPADDLCLAHVFVAARDPLAFARGRNSTGYVVGDPACVAEDSRKALQLRDEVLARAVAAEDKPTIERLQNNGSAGWMTGDDIRYFAEMFQATVQVVKPSEPAYPVHFFGSGPLGVVVGQLPTRDGSGRVCEEHWALVQSFLAAASSDSTSGRTCSPPPSKRPRVAPTTHVDADDEDTWVQALADVLNDEPDSPTAVWEPQEYAELFQDAEAISFEPEACDSRESFVEHLETLFKDHRL